MKNKALRKFNFFKSLALIYVIFFLFNCTAPPQEESKDKAIIDSLTLKQKAQLLVGTGMYFELPDSLAEKFQMPQPEITDTAYHLMVDSVRKKLPGAAGFTAEFPQLRITTQVLADGPAGLRISPKRKGIDRTYYCTAFPIATLLASSWDTALIYDVGKAMGNEVFEYGADVLLAPGMNIQRDPLCGRNFEYYSEDPLVTGKMGASMVKGVQSNGVGTSIKHFAVNNQETNRMSVNTIVSERALREIYLKGFEIAVTEAQPRTVMSSYNKINGTYASESHDLLTKILRDDWGFQGYVMTDWGGGSDIATQMLAGNDLIMPGQKKQIEELIKSVESGKLEESILDKNLSRILSIMMESPKYKGIEYSNNPDLESHAAIARKAASEGMVLLENKNKALPLTNNSQNIAVFGTTSYEFIAGGTGSGDVNEAYTVSLIEGLSNAGLSIDKGLADVYGQYIKGARAKAEKPKNWLAAIMGAKEPVPEMAVDLGLSQAMAGKSDIALVTIGRNSGEGGDREAIEGDFYLTTTEKTLIENVSGAFHAQGKKVIVILNIGGVIETASWRDLPDAVLCAWQPGQEAGNSVVDVLTGKVNPSGKLAITFPNSYSDSPTAKNFPGQAVESGEVDDAADLSGFSFMQRIPWEVIYEEDIYVGYRYYNTFNVPVAYEFGYGLSYTTFEYNNLKLSSTNFKNQVTLSVDINNSGTVAGREGVQVYLTAPQGKIEKPSMKLVDFGKTKPLSPGESTSLSFVIELDELCSFDVASSSWIAEAGKYEIKIGASSRDIKMIGEFSLEENKVYKTVSKALVPEQEIEKIHHKN